MNLVSLTRELTLNSTVGRKGRKDTHDFIIPKKNKKKDGRSDKF